jgi:hypothetical protein
VQVEQVEQLAMVLIVFLAHQVQLAGDMVVTLVIAVTLVVQEADQAAMRAELLTPLYKEALVAVVITQA